MLDTVLDTLHFAWRQKHVVYAVGDAFKAIFASGLMPKKIIAFFIACLNMFLGIADVGLIPNGDELDLTGYSLVFCDEFDGDSLNTDVWNYRALGPRRNGFNAESQIKVEDGNLIITQEYLTDGTYGEGWYAGMISLKQKYKKGYYEIRCKCNDGGEFWSAFWIQASAPYDHDISKGGIGGAELDIFEAPNAASNLLERNSVTQTIHCNGGDDDRENIDSCILGAFNGKNIYNEYNTYGLEWNDDEYIFYINGVETVRSSFSKGVSDVEEEVIVSLEIPSEITLGHDAKSQFVVDYVKIWQK